MAKAFCPNCEADRRIDVVRKPDVFEVRGIEIEVDVDLAICGDCGLEFDHPDSADPLVEVYRRYRDKMNLLQPDAIRGFRKKYGLTQGELSRLLGWGAATLSRYENGALQDDAHDRALRLAMEPGNLLMLVEQAPEHLPQEKRDSLVERIRNETADDQDLLARLRQREFAYQPSSVSGYREFSITKFRNAVLYFCCFGGQSRTKLNKLLWYADFLHFKRHTVSITGSRYAHCPHGPVPNKYSALYALLEECTKEVQTVEQNAGDHVWEELRSTVEPDKNVFSDTELRALMDVWAQFADSTARAISDFSHQEQGYRETSDGELIAYDYAIDLRI